MDIRELLSWVNLLLAFVAVPPALQLILVLRKEKNLIDKRQKKLNSILLYLFYGVSIGTIINATVSVLSLLNNGDAAHTLSPFRGVFINAFFTFVSWSIYLVHKHTKKY